MRLRVLAICLGLGGCSAVPGEPSEHLTQGVGGAGGSATSFQGGMAGMAPTECSGRVTFNVRFAGSDPRPFCPSQGCQGPFGVRVKHASGSGLGRGPGCGALGGPVYCADCKEIFCSFLCVVQPVLTKEDLVETWDGFAWDDGYACGNGTQCSAPTCAEPGPYVAEYCVYPIEADAGVPDAGDPNACMDANVFPICVQQPFEYPATAPVEIVFDPALATP